MTVCYRDYIIVETLSNLKALYPFTFWAAEYRKPQHLKPQLIVQLCQQCADYRCCIHSKSLQPCRYVVASKAVHVWSYCYYSTWNWLTQPICNCVEFIAAVASIPYAQPCNSVYKSCCFNLKCIYMQAPRIILLVILYH